METWQLILILVVILLLGLLRQVSIFRSLVKQHQTMEEFMTRFVNWCEGGFSDSQAFAWLVEQSGRVQNTLGGTGLVNYRRPFESGYHENTPIILNFLPEIQETAREQMHRSGTIHERSLNHMVQHVQGAILRWKGMQEERIDRELRRVLNPIVWFGKGIGFLVEIPLSILVEAGAISPQQKRAIANSWLYSFFSGIVALVTLLSTLMGVVMGWNNFVETISRWITQGGWS